jgi:hypothetical protein
MNEKRAQIHGIKIGYNFSSSENSTQAEPAESRLMLFCFVLSNSD